jgi:FkbM family methyltransferase
VHPEIPRAFLYGHKGRILKKARCCRLGGRKRVAKQMMNIKRLIKSGVSTLGYEISRRGPSEPQPGPEHRFFEALLNMEASTDAIRFLKYCARNMDQAHAERFQDLLVLFLLEEKRDGYFVEVGALDGINWSNTFLLEKVYGWRGIVAEPARCWAPALTRNRSCLVDHRCVWSKSGEQLQFNETADARFSTIDVFSKLDCHAKRRQGGKRYTIETISLSDLLKVHNAPRDIDYLSIDTEGSEFTILDSFFPSQHEIRIITVEHNYTEQRSCIHGLLTSWGYKRLFEGLSMQDDWYSKQ